MGRVYLTSSSDAAATIIEKVIPAIEQTEGCANCTCEPKLVEVSVPEIVEVIKEVEVPVEKIVEIIKTERIEVPVEKIIEVEKIVEKIVEIEKVVVKEKIVQDTVRIFELKTEMANKDRMAKRLQIAVCVLILICAAMGVVCVQ